MIEKTQAIVLRVAPFSTTSHVVTWLTETHGRVVTVIKGACRPRSSFLGQYDLFYTCELLFYTRDHHGIHIARECTPTQMRPALRRHWRAAFAASYVCDLLNQVAQQGHPQPELFRLAETALDFLARGEPRPQFLFWFELRLMHELGWAPQFSRCPLCRSPVSIEHPTAPRFSCARGGILCPDCAPRHASDTIAITPGAAAMLARWQRCPTPTLTQNTVCRPEQLLEFRRVLGTFLRYHLDIPLPSRKIAIELVNATTAAS